MLCYIMMETLGTTSDERRATSARSEMNNQRVLNLERMDEQQAHRFFNELASNVGAQSG